MLPYDPDDDLDFQPEAVAEEFANEIMRYLNEAEDETEAHRRKGIVLDTLQTALAAYVFNPDAQMFTRLSPFGSSDEPDDA